jgi:hypothetical protein
MYCMPYGIDHVTLKSDPREVRYFVKKQIYHQEEDSSKHWEINWKIIGDQTTLIFSQLIFQCIDLTKSKLTG